MGVLYSFTQLKQMASQKPEVFFGFNDSYFTRRLEKVLAHKDLYSEMICEQAEMLMFRSPPRQIKVSPFSPSLVASPKEREKLIANIHEAVAWLRAKVARIPQAWVIEDIPSKDVIFTHSAEILKKKKDFDGIYIVNREMEPRLLVDDPNSIVGVLSNYQNFIPRVYVSRQTYKYLLDHGHLAKLEELFGKERDVPLPKAS
jgi:hypothetical protein